MLQLKNVDVKKLDAIRNKNDVSVSETDYTARRYVRAADLQTMEKPRLLPNVKTVKTKMQIMNRKKRTMMKINALNKMEKRVRT